MKGERKRGFQGGRDSARDDTCTITWLRSTVRHSCRRIAERSDQPPTHTHSPNPRSVGLSVYHVSDALSHGCDQTELQVTWFPGSTSDHGEGENEPDGWARMQIQNARRSRKKRLSSQVGLGSRVASHERDPERSHSSSKSQPRVLCGRFSLVFRGSTPRSQRRAAPSPCSLPSVCRRTTRNAFDC